MTIGDQVAAEAIKCLGVPFVAHGRDPEKGLDCVGLVLHAFEASGIEGFDAPYSLPRSDLWSKDYPKAWRVSRDLGSLGTCF